jgi:hypothetical protein
MFGAERLVLRATFAPLGAGAMITGTVGTVSFRPLVPLDLDFDSGIATVGSDDAIGAFFGFLLGDPDFDVDAAAAADGVVGGPCRSSFLLLDLAGLADAARFYSNLDAIGAGSIFGSWSPLGTETVLLFIASALLSLALIGAMPAGGGGGPG